MCSMRAAAHAATAASTMIAPWERLSTPETPKIRVKPVAPSAYKALMAKPSIRICRVSIYDGRGSTAALLLGNFILETDKRKCSRANPGARSLGGQLDVT